MEEEQKEQQERKEHALPLNINLPALYAYAESVGKEVKDLSNAEISMFAVR